MKPTSKQEARFDLFRKEPVKRTRQALAWLKRQAAKARRRAGQKDKEEHNA